MSGYVRNAYAGIYLVERGGVCELYENGALLARTDNTAIADKLFFKRALEVASGRVDEGARVQLTAAGKVAFGCAEKGKNSVSPACGNGTKPKREVFKKPTVEEIAEYCREKGYKMTEPQAFYDRHEAGGWMVGRVKMKDWKAAVRTWERKEREYANEKAEREKQYERPRKGVALTNPEVSGLHLTEFEQDVLKYRPRFKPTERSVASGHLD